MTPIPERGARFVQAALVLLLVAAVAACGSAGGGHGGGAAVSPPLAAPSSRPPGAHTPVQLDTVHMITTHEGWALLSASNPGSKALLQPARTTDGGRTWTIVTPPGSGSMLAGGQAVLDAQSTGQAWLAVAGANSKTTTVFSTSDGGRTWQQSPAISGAQPVALDFASPARGWLLESLGAALGANPVQLFRSADGGRHWTAEARSAMGTQPEVGGIPAGCDKSGMSFGSVASGWITSFCNSLAGAVLQSADGGRHWMSARLPVPQHACQSGGCQVPAPQFAGATTFLQVNAFPSAPYLLVSTDSGTHWTVERLPGSAGPDPRTQWFSPADGITIAAGSQQSVGARSYVTSDGGASWAAVPLSRPFGNAGASFDFVSTGTGFAWIPGTATGGGRPAMYQTTDSGRTWTSFTPSLG